MLLPRDPKKNGESMDDHMGSSHAEGSERQEESVYSHVSLQTNIIFNHEFSDDLQFWHANCCHSYVASRKSGLFHGITAHLGESYAVLTNRTQSWQGLEQHISERVTSGTKYNVSAVIRVHGSLSKPTEVQATLRLENPGFATTYLCIGRKLVTEDIWEKLEGSFTLTSLPKHSIFYLEGPPPGVDLLINSVSIFPTSSYHPGRQELLVYSHVSPQSNIIFNHEFSDSLQFWHANGCHAYVASRKSGLFHGIPAQLGESYAVLTHRTQCWQGLEQDITERVMSGTKYNVLAMIRVHGSFSEASEVQATLRLENPGFATDYLCIGRKSTMEDIWEKLEGSFILPSLPKRCVFYLEGPPPGVNLLINSVAIFPTSPCDSGEIVSYFPSGDGNIIRNPFFEEGLNNWSARGCRLSLHDSMGDGRVLPFSGRYFASASGRKESWNGVQQDITGQLHRKLAYEVIAEVRIFGNAAGAEVRSTLWVESPTGREHYISIGKVHASDSEWLHLQGKFLLNGGVSKAIIFLEGPPFGTDVLVNSLIVKRAEKLSSGLPPMLENVSFAVNIIENSNLSQGLSYWSPLGSCTLSIAMGSPRLLPPSIESIGQYDQLSGLYIVASNRMETWMGPSQNITDKLVLHLTYQIAAWVRVGPAANGPQIVNLAIGVDNQWVNGGHVQVVDEKWHEIMGSFRIEKRPSKVVVYLQGPSVGVDLMIAGLHMFPVDRKARFSNLKQQTDKVRKRDVVLKFPEIYGENASNTFIRIRQLKNSFPFGSCISRSNIENEEFVDFFVKNFNWAVFANEMKWYHTEPEQGRYNYKDADEMVDFCKKHGIDTRGHCIFWEVEDAVQQWVKSLDKNDLMAAVQRRLEGLLLRYKGKFKHYDVNNEMLHGSFYRDRLGEDIQAYMFREAHKLDPSAILFVNDYNVEDGCDAKASPEIFINQVLDLLKRGAPVQGIGLQGHISNPVGEIVAAALDKLAILGLPIWFTELDVAAPNEHVRAEDLEVMLREAYAHPSVEGIVLWGFWELSMFRDDAHLVNAEGYINEAGKRYLALKQEWLSNSEGHANSVGEFEFRGYHGLYALEVTTPLKKSCQSFVVDKGESPLVLSINL